MSSPLKNIKELIPSLPKGDIAYANKYLEEKDWESLKDLTWSSYQRLENAYRRESLPEKYKGIDIDEVRELAVECWNFYYSLYPEELEEEYNDVEEE